MEVVVTVPRYLTYDVADYTLEEWMKLEDREKWDIIDGSNVEVINDETDFYSGVIEDERDYND